MFCRNIERYQWPQEIFLPSTAFAAGCGERSDRSRRDRIFDGLLPFHAINVSMSNTAVCLPFSDPGPTAFLSLALTRPRNNGVIKSRVKIKISILLLVEQEYRLQRS